MVEANQNQDLLMARINDIIKGPHADLLRKLVDLLYQHSKKEEEYDEVSLSPEELAMMQKSLADFQKGDFITLEELGKKLGL